MLSHNKKLVFSSVTQNPKTGKNLRNGDNRLAVLPAVVQKMWRKDWDVNMLPIHWI